MTQETLADLLIAAHRCGTPVGPVQRDLLPMTEEAAYAVQEAVARGLGAVIAGWKVGAATPSAEPNCAPLYADRIAHSPAHFTRSATAMRGVEAELACRIGRDLPPRGTTYGEAEVWDAIASFHVAIELLDTRYADRRSVGPLGSLADNISNGGFCYGPAIADWQHIDFLRQEAQLLVDGVEAAAAVGGNTAGHPRRLLAWLANHCIARDRPLRAGDMVTTGSHTGLVIAPPGAVVTARFDRRGDAHLTLGTP
jgi:2-keto-4-pentenoate hydratase